MPPTSDRPCATGCGQPADPGDRYCTGCGTARDRQAWAQ